MLVYVVILQHKREKTYDNIILKMSIFSYITLITLQNNQACLSQWKNSDVCQTQQHTCSWFIRTYRLILSYAILKVSTVRSYVPVDNEANVDTALFP
jgi:hypothetical protein